MLRFTFGFLTGLILAHAVGLGMMAVERRARHSTRRLDWRDVAWNAYR